MYIDRSQRIASQHGAIYFQPLIALSLSQGKDIIALEATLPEGTITIVEMRSNEYSLWWTDFTLDDDIHLTFATPPWPSLGMVYPLKKDVHYKEERLGSGVLKKHHYFLYHLASSQCEFYLEKGSYTLFGVQFSIDFAEKWTPYMRFLQPVLERLSTNEPLFIQGDTSMSESIERIIDELYRYPNLGPGNETFLDSRAIDLLRYTVENINDFSYSTDVPLSEYEIMKIREAKEYIIEHLDDHVSVIEMGIRAGLNEYAFRTGFKQLFGMPPFQFALDQRLERAKKLIEETDLPIKTIAEMSRYGSESPFIKAFKNKFGVSPGRLRFRKS